MPSRGAGRVETAVTRSTCAQEEVAPNGGATLRRTKGRQREEVPDAPLRLRGADPGGHGRLAGLVRQGRRPVRRHRQPAGQRRRGHEDGQPRAVTRHGGRHGLLGHLGRQPGGRRAPARGLPDHLERPAPRVDGDVASGGRGTSPAPDVSRAGRRAPHQHLTHGPRAAHRPPNGADTGLFEKRRTDGESLTRRSRMTRFPPLRSVTISCSNPYTTSIAVVIADLGPPFGCRSIGECRYSSHRAYSFGAATT